jgi:hypothetical protein
MHHVETKRHGEQTMEPAGEGGSRKGEIMGTRGRRCAREEYPTPALSASIYPVIIDTNCKQCNKYIISKTHTDDAYLGTE